MNILKNAVDSIEMGVEDFSKGKKGDEKRFISCARNLFSGLLLLFKHKLASMSSNDHESLIKVNIVPVINNGNLNWRGDGSRTIDVQGIEKRFKALNINTNWGKDTTWKNVLKMRDFRNNIEHYYDTKNIPAGQLNQIIVDCFKIACAFMRDELQSEPQAVFTKKSWKILTGEKDFYDKEQMVCRNLLNKIKWENDDIKSLIHFFRCEKCASVLFKPVLLDDMKKAPEQIEYICACCGQNFNYRDLLDNVCMNMNAHDFRRIAKGGEDRFAMCPACASWTFDTDNDLCLFCKAEDKFHCSQCGDILSAHDYSNLDGLCGDCAHINYQINKDD